MRSLALAAASLLCVLALPASAGPEPLGLSPGPFAGVVAPDATATHHYQNVPDGTICIQIVQPYTVVVESTGPVHVSVWGRHGVTVTGVGSFTFESGVCTSFDIHVENVGETAAAYAIQVTGNRAGQVSLGDIGFTCSEIC